jgi:hypothetical protein
VLFAASNGQCVVLSMMIFPRSQPVAANDEHVRVLREIRAIYGDAQNHFTMEKAALECAIRAISAQQAAAVAWQYRRKGSDEPWINVEGALNADYGRDYWEVRKLYTRAATAEQPQGAVSEEMVERFCSAFFKPTWPTSAMHNDSVLRETVRAALTAALRPDVGKGRGDG